MLKTSTLAVMLVAALSAIAAPSASAYSPTQLLNNSLQVGDVPTSFFVNMPKQRATSYLEQPNTKRFDMCVDKGGNKLFGLAPAQHANSAILLYQQESGNAVSATRAVASDIYGYANAAKAKAAWKALLAAKKRCASKASITAPSQGGSVDMKVTQQLKTSKPSGGIPGYTIDQKIVIAAGENGLSTWIDIFSAYRMVDATIVRTQFANNTTISLAKSKLTASWRNFADVEALRIARRLR